MKKTIINPIIKDEVTFVQTSASTNGRITTLQVRLMPGGGTPFHYHKNFSETFIVIDGELTIQLDKKTVILSAGQKLEVKQNIPHRFANSSAQPVLFTTMITPGSEGFENALRILYGLAADGKTDKKGMPKNPFALAFVSKISDMRPAGAGVVIVPVMGLFYFLAKISGLNRKLENSYCKS